MRILDDNLDNGLDLIVIFVFLFYFIFSLFCVYWISRGIVTVNQCSCRRADDKDRIPLILKSKFEVAGTNRHIAVVTLDLDNKVSLTNSFIVFGYKYGAVGRINL